MPAILIAGGGTGGHVFPGIAVAHALRQIADVDVVFAGASRGLELGVVPEAGYEIELLEVEPMKGGGPERAIRGALVAAKATQQARRMVRRRKLAAVVSVGGYAAGPAALACVAERVPLAILEPNSTLGLANRLLAPFARRAYVAWAETGRHFRRDKARLYGVPLRPGFLPRPSAPSAPNVRERRVLVLGGSQGAAALNDVVPRAIALAVDRGLAIRVVHQSGKDRDADVRAAYARAGVGSVEVTPFLDDVAERMGEADLVVARSGAVTVAEISAIGRAAIFVPFPYAADDHQAKNALSLAAIGGAVCSRQEAADEERLAAEIGALLTDEVRRARMADAAREHGRPNAADDIARDLLELARIALRRPSPGAAAGRGDPPKKNGANGSSVRIKLDVERKGVS